MAVESSRLESGSWSRTRSSSEDESSRAGGDRNQVSDARLVLRNQGGGGLLCFFYVASPETLSLSSLPSAASTAQSGVLLTLFTDTRRSDIADATHVRSPGLCGAFACVLVGVFPVLSPHFCSATELPLFVFPGLPPCDRPWIGWLP